MKYLSPVYSQGSGSIAGITYSHNRFGNYTRMRVTPVNPSSTQQQFVRNAFGALAVIWATTLTTAQRDAWDLYADNVPVLDKLGQSINLTGMNMFIRSNTPRQQLNNIAGSVVLPIVLTGPTTFSLAETDPSASATVTTPSAVSTTFDDQLDWVTEDEAALFVYSGRPANASINFFGGPNRFAGITLGDLAIPPTSPAATTSLYTYAAGQKAFLQARISRADGRLSAIFKFPSVIVL